jgi:hypothetical protein
MPYKRRSELRVSLGVAGFVEDFDAAVAVLGV